MTQVTIYTKNYCPYCKSAKALLDRKGVAYREIDVTYDESMQAEMMDRAQRRTVPQIFVGEHHIGGSDDLVALDRNGEFDRLIDTAAAA